MSMIMSTGRDTPALMEHHLGYLTQCFYFDSWGAGERRASNAAVGTGHPLPSGLSPP